MVEIKGGMPTLKVTGRIGGWLDAVRGNLEKLGKSWGITGSSALGACLWTINFCSVGVVPRCQGSLTSRERIEFSGQVAILMLVSGSGQSSTLLEPP